MPTNAKTTLLAGAFCLLAVSLASAEPRRVTVDVRFEISGEAQLRVWSRSGELDFAPALPRVLECEGDTKLQSGRLSGLDCSHGLRRDGLSLETVLDLAPIAAQLDPTDEIVFRIEYPHLGFETLTTPLDDESESMLSVRSLNFEAGSPPPPIRLRLGYRPAQLAWLYLPQGTLALVLTLLARLFARRRLAELNFSLFVLGTVSWMGLAARFQAGAPLRLVFYATPLAQLAATMLAILPPLLCVALGAALGCKSESDGKPSDKFSGIFWGFGIFLLPMLCAAGGLPSMATGDWAGAVPWLLALPAVVLLCRIGLRSRTGRAAQQVTEGPLKERVAQLAARVGRPQIRVYILFSSKLQQANAFALPRRGIYFTAPLLQSLTTREVDAVAAHELHHFLHTAARPWSALAAALVLFETPVAGQILSSAPIFLFCLLFPPILYLFALRGMRQREFDADSGATALLGDPRPMIGALAKVACVNGKPLAAHPVVEWFSTHPSTLRRIQAMAAAAGISGPEVESLIHPDSTGEHYSLPDRPANAIFTPAWQRRTAINYSWAALLGASASGLLVSWLLYRMAPIGPALFFGGALLGCLVPKGIAAAVMAIRYRRLRRQLEAKLGVTGQIVGLAADCEPRVYGGYRFPDAGLLRFDGNRLCYRSERTEILLNPADAIEVAAVAAAPSSWFRLQPTIRFRHPETGAVHSIILHPLDFLPKQRGLLLALRRWQANSNSSARTEIEGLQTVPGQLFRNPDFSVIARTFLIPGGLTLTVSLAACSVFQTDWFWVLYALAVTAWAHFAQLLPSMLYRVPSPILDTPTAPA